MAPDAKPRDLCLVAQRLPHCKPTRDQGEANKRARLRMSVQKIVHHLMMVPDCAEQVWGSMQAGLACDAEHLEEPADVDSTPKKQLEVASNTFGRLENAVFATFLSQMPDGPSASLLDMMLDLDKFSVADFFFFVFLLSRTDKIPKRGHNTILLTHALRLRLADLPINLKEVLAQCVDAEGNVD